MTRGASHALGGLILLASLRAAASQAAMILSPGSVSAIGVAPAGVDTSIVCYIEDNHTSILNLDTIDSLLCTAVTRNGDQLVPGQQPIMIGQSRRIAYLSLHFRMAAFGNGSLLCHGNDDPTTSSRCVVVTATSSGGANITVQSGLGVNITTGSPDPYYAKVHRLEMVTHAHTQKAFVCGQIIRGMPSPGGIQCSVISQSGTGAVTVSQEFSFRKGQGGSELAVALLREEPASAELLVCHGVVEDTECKALGWTEAGGFTDGATVTLGEGWRATSVLHWSDMKATSLGSSGAVLVCGHTTRCRVVRGSTDDLQVSARYEFHTKTGFSASVANALDLGSGKVAMCYEEKGFERTGEHSMLSVRKGTYRILTFGTNVTWFGTHVTYGPELTFLADGAVSQFDMAKASGGFIICYDSSPLGFSKSSSAWSTWHTKCELIKEVGDDSLNSTAAEAASAGRGSRQVCTIACAILMLSVTAVDWRSH